jgi:hypothetical protein
LSRRLRIFVVSLGLFVVGFMAATVGISTAHAVFVTDKVWWDRGAPTCNNCTVSYDVFAWAQSSGNGAPYATGLTVGDTACDYGGEVVTRTTAPQLSGGNWRVEMFFNMTACGRQPNVRFTWSHE